MNRDCSNISKKIDELDTKLKNIVRCAKNKYYSQLFSNTSTKDTWKAINKVIHGTRKHPEHTVIKMNNQSDGGDTCNIFAEYFSNIGQNLSDQIPTQPGDHPNKLNTIDVNNSSIFLRPTTPNEVELLIRALRVNKACGIDNISATVIKRCSHILSTQISNLINLCFETGQYPDDLKVAKVVPIHKGGDKDKVENYRPISVLPIINNVVERAIYNRLLSFLESVDFFYEQQHGFRPKHSTNIAIAEIVDMLQRELNQKGMPTALFMDLSKAFDCVNHIILLYKLEMAGIRGVALKLFESYLTNRHIKVKVNEVISEPAGMNVGVPQGSILGPILYLIYVNDLAKLSIHGNIRLFADDTSIFYTQNTTHQNMIAMKRDLELIDEYYRINKLTVNLSKIEYIHFHSHKRAPPTTDVITYKGTAIKNVISLKHLGLIFDSTLQWTAHIDKIATKLASVVGVFTKISSFLPTHVMKLLYFALFHSRIEYASTNWTATAKTHLNKIQVLQNKALKTCYKLNSRHSSLDLYANVARNIIPIVAMKDYQACKITHTIINRIKPSKIQFEYKTRESRRGPEIAPAIKPKNQYGLNSISHNGPTQFNSLPSEIKNCTSTKEFQKRIKTHYCKLESLKNKL